MTLAANLVEQMTDLSDKMAEAFWNAGRERFVNPPPDYPAWEDVRKIPMATATTNETARCVRKAAQVLREPNAAVLTVLRGLVFNEAGEFLPDWELADVWHDLFDAALPNPPEDFKGHRL